MALEPVYHGHGLYCGGCLETLEVPRIQNPEERLIYLNLAEELHSDCHKYGDQEAAKRAMRGKKHLFVARDGWKRGLNLPRRTNKVSGFALA